MKDETELPIATQNLLRKRISRRDFLKAAGYGTGAAFLAACGAQTETPTATTAPTASATSTEAFITPVAQVTANPDIELFGIAKQIELAEGGASSQTENLQPVGVDIMSVPAVYDASGELNVPATVKAVALENANRNTEQIGKGLIPPNNINTLYTVDQLTDTQFSQALRDFPSGDTLDRIARVRKFYAKADGSGPDDPKDLIFAGTKEPNQFYWLRAVVAPESEGGQDVIRHVWTKQITAGGEFGMYWDEATGKWAAFPTGKGAEVTATPSPEPTVDVQKQVSAMETIDAAKHPEQIAALSVPVAVEAWLQKKIDVTDPDFGLQNGSFDNKPTLIHFGEAVEQLGVPNLNEYFHKYPGIILGFGPNNQVYVGMETKTGQRVVANINYAETIQVGYMNNSDSTLEEFGSPYSPPENRDKFNQVLKQRQAGDLVMIDLATFGDGSRADLLKSMQANFARIEAGGYDYNAPVVAKMDFSETPDPEIIKLIACAAGQLLAHWKNNNPEDIMRKAMDLYGSYTNAPRAVDFLNGSTKTMPNSISGFTDLSKVDGGRYFSLVINKK